MKKKDCYCSGYTRKDGSKILCSNCENERVSKILKENKPISIKQIKKDFIDEQYIDDYTTDSDIHGFNCKICYILYGTKSQAIDHFQEMHNK